MHHVCSL